MTESQRRMLVDQMQILQAQLVVQVAASKLVFEAHSLDTDGVAAIFGIVRGLQAAIAQVQALTAFIRDDGAPR